jgi:hypothetical protein
LARTGLKKRHGGGHAYRNYSDDRLKETTWVRSGLNMGRGQAYKNLTWVKTGLKKLNMGEDMLFIY